MPRKPKPALVVDVQGAQFAVTYLPRAPHAPKPEPVRWSRTVRPRFSDNSPEARRARGAHRAWRRAQVQVDTSHDPSDAG